MKPDLDAVDAAATLSEFATRLRLEDIPATALAAAKNCLIDAVACCIFGSRFAWSQTILSAAALPPGKVVAPGIDTPTDAAKAAMLSGAFAHAFELDSLRKPGAGVHPGATVALPALAVAQATGASGNELLVAIVAAIEVMFRIGAATLHSAEQKGFHAPGITGVFGSAVASSRLMRLSADKMRNAIALSASMTGGLLQFAASGSGGMVKRLHLARAAEAGVEAARLAAAGFEGPVGVLEGKFGILNAFCDKRDPSLLTEELGETFEVGKLCIKRYPCHVTAQAAVQALYRLRAEHGFGNAEVKAIRIAAPPKIAAQHSDPHPRDIALAQYSLPFMLAYSMFHDLDDPHALTENGIVEPAIHAMADRIAIRADEALSGWNLKLQIELISNVRIEDAPSTFLGAPDCPLGQAALRERFMRLTADFSPDAAASLYSFLQGIEDVASVAHMHIIPSQAPR